jgi:hypothetical protein
MPLSQPERGSRQPIRLPLGVGVLVAGEVPEEAADGPYSARRRDARQVSQGTQVRR